MNIHGIWYNELGSTMSLIVNGNSLTGKYQTAVGDAKGTYDLVGQIDVGSNADEALGWVVLWSNEFGSKNSITTWSGQRQQINGVDTIMTTWLLTTETAMDGEWRSTLVGKDVFTRQKPNLEQLKTKGSAGQRTSFPY
jgi:hypothetical protein